MARIINTIFLHTTLIMMSCINIYASEEIKTMYYVILTSRYDNIKDYKINKIVEIEDPDSGETVKNPLYGAIYDQKPDGKYYLIDEEGNKFFDLQTIVTNPLNEIISDRICILENSGMKHNVIVASFDNDADKTYTLKVENSDNIFDINLHTHNLIIP